jgi:tripartite-type tricarboxylate transporter receptor subunit TctC
MINRRHFMTASAAGLALAATSRGARAQAYPSQPVRIMVGFAPGTAADVNTRLLGQWLSERFGQSFIIDNRTGAGSNIATEAVVRAPADGYTLLYATTANAFNATIYENLKFNFIRDTTPVASFIRNPGVMVVNPAFPAQTVPEFIAYAKANPGKINMGTAGVGSAAHIWGELFKVMAGVDMTTVHYRGYPLADLIGGQVQVLFDNLPGSIEYIRAGTIRALAVTTEARLDVLPDVPTIGEFVVGYEAEAWHGIVAPKNTPADVIDTLNRAINAALADPTMKARIAALGGSPLANSPAGFARHIAEEIEKWGKVIRAANIKAD